MEAVAIHTYSPSNKDELAFHQGDTIKILNVDNPDWFYAELEGAEGLVPENYLTFSLPVWFLPLTKAESVTFLKQPRGVGYQHPDGAFLVRPSESNRNELSISLRIRDTQHFKILRAASQYFLWKAGPSFSSVNQLITHYRRSSVSAKESAVLVDMALPKVIASYDFDARTRDELTIKRGEIITVLSRDDPNFSKGHLERDGRSQRGLFPTNYVTAYSE